MNDFKMFIAMVVLAFILGWIVSPDCGEPSPFPSIHTHTSDG